MALVKTPLLGLDASGSIAHSITFSKWKGRNYVRRTVKPANPRSSSQLARRSLIRYLTKHWATLSGANQTTWDAQAKSRRISPFNFYVGYNASGWSHGNSPSNVYPSVVAAAEAAPTADTATAGIKEIVIAWTDSAGANDQATLIYRSLVTGFTPTVNNLVAIVAHGVLTWTDVPLATGTPYFYRLRGCDKTGNLGTLAAEITATPT